MRLLDRADNRVVEVERVEGLHVDDLARHPELVERARRIEGNCAASAIRHHGYIGAGAQHLRHAQGDGEVADVLGHALLQPVPVERLDDDAGVVAAEESVVEAGRLRHVSRDGDVHDGAPV